MSQALRSVWSEINAAGRSVLAAAEAALAYADAEYAFRLDVRSREPMDDRTFWVTSYKNAGIPFEIATTVRRVYGEQLGHDPLKLRADDFDPQIWDIDTIELQMEVEEAFGLTISHREAERTSGSIDSIVRLVARKIDDERQVRFPRASAALASLNANAGCAPLPGPAPARRTASSG